VQSTGLKFLIPSTYSEFVIFERLEGDYTTDFGVPGIIASSESEPVNALDLQRFNTVLKACWEAFDRAVGQAKGKELRKGPRGGGRDAKKILEYVVGAEQSYLRRLVWKSGKAKEMSLEEEIKYTRAETLTALERAVKEGLPTQGPRGGKIWPPRYFVRRVAWHVLDHAWEIEDRII